MHSDVFGCITVMDAFGNFWKFSVFRVLSCFVGLCKRFEKFLKVSGSVRMCSDALDIFGRVLTSLEFAISLKYFFEFSGRVHVKIVQNYLVSQTTRGPH